MHTAEDDAKNYDYGDGYVHSMLVQQTNMFAEMMSTHKQKMMDMLRERKEQEEEANSDMKRLMDKLGKQHEQTIKEQEKTIEQTQ